MGIYRGPGGTGDAVADTSNESASAVASAAAAATSASSASASANSASSSSSAASVSATLAQNSATSASASAASAVSSASNAQTYSESAATSATNAANSYDEFDDRYLGAKSSAPTLDNDGNALLTGALYWNSTDNKMYSWSGSAWVAITGAGAGSGTVTSVAMSVPTGLVVTGSPITSSGTLAVAYDTGYGIPTTVKQGQWDTAYGWGNHASAGYLTTSSAASTYQPLDGDLTAIAGLAGTSGFLKKTGANTWTLDTNSYLTSYIETDPVFVASPAYNITGTKISNWDDSYTFVAAFPSQTGNSGKYLTTNGSVLSWATVSGGATNLDSLTDVVITSASAGQVLKYNGTNWINDTDSTGSGSFAYPTGTGIVTVSGGSSWGTTLTAPTGAIVGTTDTQTLTNKTISGSSNTLSNIANASLTNSSITINGSAISLGGSTSVGTVTSVAALTLGTTGTDLSSTVANGTTTPVITLNVPTASASNRGALSSADWSTFNGKQAALVSGTNIKTVNSNSLLGSGNVSVGTVTSITAGTGLSGGTITGSGTIAIDSTVATLTGTQTLTNKTISGASNTLSNIANASLTNSSVTVNGTAISLGGSATVTASTTNALTIGTGLSGSSFNGGSAVTIAIDSTVATLTGTQTLTNKTLTAPVISSIVNTGTLTLPTSTDTLVGRATTDTLTNKTLTSPTMTGATLNDGYTEEVFTVTDGTSVVLSPTNGSIQTWTLGASRTPSAGTWAAGQSMTLMIDDGTAFTITWSTVNVVWETDGGSAPTLATTGFTTIILWKVGTQIYGARVGNN